MKNTKFLSLCLALFFSMSFIACSDDDNGNELPSNPVLTLNTNQIPLTSIATNGKVEIISNVAWTTLKSSGANWLTINPDKGAASSDAITVTFSAEANNSTQARTAVVKFVHMQGEKIDSVVVRQEGAIPEPLRYQDSLALVALYNGTKGPGWKASWDLEVPMSEWAGVTTDLIDGQIRVTAIELTDNNLVGSKFPEELANLSELKKFVITLSVLNCDLPSFIGEWKNLEFLALAQNGHTGQIPDVLYSLTKLQTLHLYGNALTGSISDKLGDLVNMVDLNLEGNQLRGGIPSSIGNLTKLDGLILDKNPLGGMIPAEIKNCTALRIVTLIQNGLTGNMTGLFDNMGKLEVLDVCTNQLSGNLPALTSCKQLFDLRFSDNKGLNGELPASWMNLDSLMIIQGYSCSITGGIPDEFENLPALADVILDSNNMSGEIPVFARKWRTFNVGANHFSGTLPALFVSNNLCSELNLSGNDLEGDVSGLFGSVVVEKLYLSGMPKLTGTLPDDGMGFDAIREINLEGSGFSGEIPGKLFYENASEIVSVNLANCNFTGNLPTEIANAISMTTFKVKGNKLSGEINAQIKKNTNWSTWKPAENICPQQGGLSLTGCE